MNKSWVKNCLSKAKFQLCHSFFKGLPDDESEIDSDYLFLIDLIDSGYYTFQGVTGLTDIVYNMSAKTWTIKSWDGGGTVLGLYNQTDLSPLGAQDWFLRKKMKYAADELQPIKLKLTRVRF